MKEPEMQFRYFACVVDGEFAGTLCVGSSMPALIAGMESNPTIIPITKEQERTFRGSDEQVLVGRQWPSV